MNRSRKLFLVLVFVTTAVPIAAQSAIPTLSVTRNLLIAPEAGDFSFIGSMLVVQGGVIVVTQPQDNGIRFYSQSGELLGKFGRAGSGPGEFRYVGYLGRIGDTIWVPDVSLRRASLVSMERKFLGTRPLPTSVVFRSPEAGQVTFFDPYPFAAYTDGSLLFRGTSGRASAGLWPPPPRVASEYPFLRVGPDGTVRQIVAWLPTSQTCDGQRVSIPFCQEPIDAVSADGRRIVFGASQPGVASVARLRLTALGESGDTVFSRSVEAPLSRIPGRVIDSTRSAKASRAPNPQARDEILRMRMPTHYPAFERLVAGQDGTVWVELRSEGDDREWLLLASNGNTLGRVRLPRSVKIMAASRNQIWGVIENVDGELGIVRYAVK